MKKIKLIILVCNSFMLCYSQNPFKTDSTVIQFFKNSSIKSTAIERRDSNSSTRIGIILSKPSFLNITESQSLVQIKNSPFLSSTVQTLDIAALRNFNFETSSDTVKGLKIEVGNFAQYSHNNRIAYIDYDEIPVLYSSLSDLIQTWKNWNGKLSSFERKASFKSIDNFSIILRQKVNDKEVLILASIGYFYPVIFELEPEELIKIKQSIERSLPFFRQM